MRRAAGRRSREQRTRRRQRAARRQSELPRRSGSRLRLLRLARARDAADGTDVLVVTQKSGVGYALNPDRRGKKLWEYRWGTRQPGRRRLGRARATASARTLAVADQLTPAPGGLHAVDLTTGQRVWYVPPQTPVCATGRGCSAAQSAALTSIPGVVFSGWADGAMRAYASDSGKMVWTFDTNRDFDTVNGVKADGGSIDGPGPVVAGGMLYVTAGNAGSSARPATCCSRSRSSERDRRQGTAPPGISWRLGRLSRATPPRQAAAAVGRSVDRDAFRDRLGRLRQAHGQHAVGHAQPRSPRCRSSSRA